MTNKVEAATIRAQLKLRQVRWQQGPIVGVDYQVWTTIHGSNGLFRWITVYKETYEWYKQRFKLQNKEEIITNENKETDQGAKH